MKRLMMRGAIIVISVITLYAIFLWSSKASALAQGSEVTELTAIAGRLIEPSRIQTIKWTNYTAGTETITSPWLPSLLPLNIDFNRAFQVIPEHQQLIASELARNHEHLPPTRDFVVTAVREEEDWFKYVIVPMTVLEHNWQDIKGSDIIEVLIIDGPTTKLPEAHLLPPFLERQGMQSILGSTESSPGSIQAVPYKFPWARDETWLKTNGWHAAFGYDNAIDFAPAKNPAIFSASNGSVLKICQDGHQVNFFVSNSDGVTAYLHLSQDSAQTNLDGKSIGRNEYLGLAYNGTAKGKGTCEDNPDLQYKLQYNTPCGCGTGAHLHFNAPNRSINIDDYPISSVAGSPNGTPYTSSNRFSIEGGVGGRVFDVNNQPVPNAEVKILDADELIQTTTTDNSGWYRFHNVFAGHAKITAVEGGMTGEVSMIVQAYMDQQAPDIKLTV